MGDFLESVFGPLTNTKGVIVLAVLTVGLSIASVILPRVSARVREVSLAADISPLWLLLPSGALVMSILGMPVRSSPAALVKYWQLILLLAQVGLSGWIIYRHRRWLWIVLPLVLVMLVWPGIALVAWAYSGMAH